jgi:hypothetical protein
MLQKPCSICRSGLPFGPPLKKRSVATNRFLVIGARSIYMTRNAKANNSLIDFVSLKFLHILLSTAE